MIRYYDCISDIVEPLFRRLNNSTFNELLTEINPNEEIIGIFEKNDIKIAPFIDSQINYDKFMNSIHSNHFDKFEFYATEKKITTPSNKQIGFFLEPLNLSMCLLSIEQKVILPDHVLNVEKVMEEKREIAVVLRQEVKKDLGLGSELSPRVVDYPKVKSRSGSSENMNGLKKSVSFKDILTDILLIPSNVTVDSQIVTKPEYLDSATLSMDS